MGQLCERMVDLLSRRIEKRVVLLGLDNAGKTTCVYRLLLGKKIDTVPTVGFNSEEVRYNRCNFIMWDIGGQAKIRKLWKHYVESADALIFVVDSQDRARLREARAAFKRMLRHKTLRNTVLLIYANKTDYEHSMSPAEIVEGLDVKRVVGDRKWFIQKTCAISGQGLREGLDWLSRALEVHGSCKSSSSSCCSNNIEAGPKEDLGEDEGEEEREEEEQVAEGLGTPESSSSSMVIKGSSCCGWGWRWRRRRGREEQPAASLEMAGQSAGCPRAPEEEATRRRRSRSHSGGNGSGNGHGLGKEEREQEEGREGRRGVQVTAVAHSLEVQCHSIRQLSVHEQQKVGEGVEEGGEEEEAEEEEDTEEDDEEEEVKCSSLSRGQKGGGEGLPSLIPPLPPVTFTSNTTAQAMAQAQMFG